MVNTYGLALTVRKSNGFVETAFGSSMSKKPVSPKAHGITDCVFSGIQLFASQLLGLNSTVAKTCSAAGAGFLTMNALTDTPVALKPVLPFKQHQFANAVFLNWAGFFDAVAFFP